MNYKKVSEIEQKSIKVIVTDYISKKQYFADSEVVGWLLLSNENTTTDVYHLCRRGFDEQKNEEVDELLIYTDLQLSGEELDKEIEVMLAEADLQYQTGQNNEILSKIKSSLKGINYSENQFN